jgi:hypothetical protein
VVGLLLMTLGALAAIDVASTDSVLPSTYAGAALLVVGGGLVVGGWWGRARWLIALAVLLVPPAIALGFVRMPLDGTWGTERFAPASAAELRDTYEVAGGRLTLDLSQLPALTAERRVSAEVAVGRLRVILPEGARADVTATVGAGTSEVLGGQLEGTDLADRRVSEGDGAPLVVELEVGLGGIVVETAGSGE